jgi:sugar phosphate isomerase/epimerase
VSKILIGLVLALAAHGAEAPLYVFDNGTGRGTLSVAEQVELTKNTGYAGIFYSGTQQIPELVAAHKAAGLKVVGIYTGMNTSDAKPGYDPGLPAAIKQLRGTGALITFTVNGKAPNGDEIALPIIREVADMAAKSGLRMALYPHYGMHVARIEDALRVIEKANRPNLGLVFNLCHWLRSGDEANLALRLKQALPHTFMLSINGADHTGDWDRLIQTLDRGEFDVKGFLAPVRGLGYAGPVALQCYNVKGDREENLRRSMAAWRKLQ